jgi:hypothetical protein
VLAAHEQHNQRERDDEVCGVRAVTDARQANLTENLTSGSPHMVILTDSEYNWVYSLMLAMQEIVAKSSKSMGMSGGRGTD